MDRAGLGLLGIGMFGVLFLVPFLVGFSGNMIFAVLIVPFLLASALPLWKEVKGYIASGNHGRQVKIDWKQMPIASLKAYCVLIALPFFKIESMIKDYRVWKLNRKPKPLKYRFKALKPVVKDGEGNPITLTSRGAIVFLTVFSWIVFYSIAFFVLKLNSVDDFSCAGVFATAILVSFLMLYVRRRIRRQVIQLIKKPKFGRWYWITSSLIIMLGLTASFNYGLHLWWIGSGLGLTLVLISYLKSVRKRGFADMAWTGARFDASKLNSRNFGHSIRGGNKFSFNEGRSFKFRSSDDK